MDRITTTMPNAKPLRLGRRGFLLASHPPLAIKRRVLSRNNGLEKLEAKLANAARYREQQYGAGLRSANDPDHRRLETLTAVTSLNTIP